MRLLALLALAAGPAFADTAEINGAEIFYETVGEGPPVLVLHGGLGLDHTYLRPYFDALADTNQVIYYDHFGNGRSTRPADYAEMTFDRLASDAAGLLDHLGHESAVVIGHSYGGFIAQHFAITHPDRLSGLALLNTVPAFDYAPGVSGTEEQMAAFGKLFSQPMASDADFQETWNAIIPMYFADYDPEVGAALDAATSYSGEAWNAAGALLATFNTLEDLPSIAVPTFVVGGASDPITLPGPGAERIAGLIPGADLAIFEGSAHYPFITEEDAFFTRLDAWLAGLN